MGAGRALLDPADVQGGRCEVHLIPAQVHQLATPAGRAGRPPGSWWRPGGPSGCPWRPSISRSTSASVRYSRVRSSALGRRVGVTVRFSVAGVTSLRCDFAMVFQPPLRSNCSYNGPITNSQQAAHDHWWNDFGGAAEVVIFGSHIDPWDPFGTNWLLDFKISTFRPPPPPGSSQRLHVGRGRCFGTGVRLAIVKRGRPLNPRCIAGIFSSLRPGPQELAWCRTYPSSVVCGR